MYDIRGDRISFYWDKDVLFEQLCAESIYNVHAEASDAIDAASISADERPFFDNNIPEAFASLRSMFLPAMLDDEVSETDGDQLRFAIIARRSHNQYPIYLDSASILDGLAAEYMRYSLLLKWYQTMDAKTKIEYYAVMIAAGVSAIIEQLFRFIRPAYGSSVVEVIDVFKDGHRRPNRHAFEIIPVANPVNSASFVLIMHGHRIVLPTTYEASAQADILTITHITTGVKLLTGTFREFRVGGQVYHSAEAAVAAINLTIRNLAIIYA